MPFPSEIREKLLLWCDRHCCLCKKACDVFIECHHIVPEAQGGGDDEDNAMPVCFDCHAKLSH
jgi:5-methylcytosine-specific restriction endonuclease McrA